MKKTICTVTCLVLVLLLTALTACNNTDPNIAKKETQNGYEVAEATEKPTLSDDFYDDVNLDAYANRSYELRYLFAVSSFNKPEELSVNVLVQYAFCHLFYENLCEMPKTGMQYRDATEEDLVKELEKQFGPVTKDLKTANLYSSGRGVFEMFEPNYGTEIFYDVEGQLMKNGDFRIKTVFYTDSSKETVMGTTFLTIGEYNGNKVIKSLTSKQG